MRSITHKATLVYLDGPQVIEATDVIGGHYVGVLGEAEDGTDRFAVVGVTPERLRQFRVGRLDLCELMTDRPLEEWYLATPPASIAEPMALEPQRVPLESTTFLPDPGFFLHREVTVAETLATARTRNNLVLEFAVEPPETAGGHRIRLATLSRLLAEVQMLAKHAYARAWRGLPEAVKRHLDKERGSLFDVVVPAAAGSFSVTLEASQEPDLWGASELARALRLVDQLFASVDDPVSNLEVVREYKGHLAGAYIRLLRLLVENDTNLRYTWAEPADPEVHAGSVGRMQANTLVEVFDREANLEREEFTIEGELSKADAKNDTWRLETSEGRMAGTRTGGGPSLAGLVIGGRYQFKCVEELSTTERGTEQRTLYLVEYQELR